MNNQRLAKISCCIPPLPSSKFESAAPQNSRTRALKRKRAIGNPIAKPRNGAVVLIDVCLVSISFVVVLSLRSTAQPYSHEMGWLVGFFLNPVK